MSTEEKLEQDPEVKENAAEPKTKAEKKKKCKVSDLEGEIEELKNKIAKDKDDYIRLMAEFDNYRRRTSEEKINLISTASEETIKGLLPILDDIERGMKVVSESSDSEASKEGMSLMYEKLLSYLKTKGLSLIEAKGLEFNTDFHEAVAQFPVPEEDQKGKIFDVALNGYTLNGKVIRYAKVVVGI